MLLLSSQKYRLTFRVGVCSHRLQEVIAIAFDHLLPAFYLHILYLLLPELQFLSQAFSVLSHVFLLIFPHSSIPIDLLNDPFTPCRIHFQHTGPYQLVELFARAVIDLVTAVASLKTRVLKTH